MAHCFGHIQWRIQELLVGVLKGVDGGAESSERGVGGAKRRSAEGWGLGPQYGGYAPRKFSKINVEMAYFSAFLQAEMVFFAVAARQD